ncbi:hypothetical protein DFH07DRAFT_965063 [Mycena maculata]|uniref:Uncharacterized protein n=1 Tax=Mycena maculata TaxID=230809 RepID=A0AAD7IGI8_9AGAR|nr:hypothetical protein DFH07DRAFT_965063 [Mycena maculata]
MFFNGICLLLFSLAVFFLLQTHPSQLAILDVYLAALFSQILQIFIATGPGIPDQVLGQRWYRVALVRETLTATNNALTDCLFLYRCAVIWGSRYSKIVIAVPSLFILGTLAAGYFPTFSSTDAITIPYALALATNGVLLGLTGGILSKAPQCSLLKKKGLQQGEYVYARREATILLGAGVAQRYNMTLEIM